MHRIGDLLIQYSIEHTHGLMPSQWSYDIQPNGHVKIASPIDIYVNLSYSFPYIICAIDHLPIGADIEEIKGMDDLNIAKQFSTNEFNQIQTLEDFYTIWTKRKLFKNDRRRSNTRISILRCDKTIILSAPHHKVQTTSYRQLYHSTLSYK